MIRMMVPKSLGRHIMCIFADSKDDENYYVKVLDKMKVSDLRGVNWNRLFKSGETTFLLLFLILLLLLFMTTIVVPKVWGKDEDIRLRGVNRNKSFKSGETTFVLLLLLLFLLTTIMMNKNVVPRKDEVIREWTGTNGSTATRPHLCCFVFVDNKYDEQECGAKKRWSYQMV